MDQHELFMDALRQVAKLCAVAAMTAPKSGGQLFLKGAKPFIETVIVEERDALNRLDRKSTRLNSSHNSESRMPSSA
jgi:uncharacterized ferredoxin-like protein